MLNRTRDYSAAFAALLHEQRLLTLGPGVPNTKMRPQLAALDLQQAFAPHAVVAEDMARACLAGLWLYHDFLEESHRLSQSISSSTGSYWHGLMHRREPDYSNSKHWFHRVGAHPIFPALQQHAAQLAAASENHPSSDFLKGQPQWEPFAFIDLCESCAERRSPAERLCRQIQMYEWQLLFDYSYRKAIGAT
ncbi:hypothetical protein HUU05_26610 [candidate division KSB1 bacterium]|nr:hypothetical protein [candidate division KSB1 bacterium]